MNAQSSPPAPAPVTFRVTAPMGQGLVAEFPVHSAYDVSAAVQRARSARGWWVQLSDSERVQKLGQWADWCEQNAEEFVDLGHRESGLPRATVGHELRRATQSIRAVAPRPAGRLRRAIGRAPAPAPSRASTDEVVAVLTGDEVVVSDLAGTMARSLASGSAVVVDIARRGTTAGVWWVESFCRSTFDAPPGLVGWVTSSAETRDAWSQPAADAAVHATPPPAGEPASTSSMG